MISLCKFLSVKITFSFPLLCRNKEPLPEDNATDNSEQHLEEEDLDDTSGSKNDELITEDIAHEVPGF